MAVQTKTKTSEKTEAEKYIESISMLGSVELFSSATIKWGIKEKGKFLKQYAGCNTTWCPGISATSKQYSTGLHKVPGLQEYFEEEFGFEKGYLSPRSTNEYWQNYAIKIPAKGLRIDLTTLTGQLNYVLLQADNTVCLSLSEFTNNESFDFVIHKKNEEVKIQVTEEAQKAKAYALMSGLTQKDKIDIMYLMGKGAEDTDPDTIDHILYTSFGTVKGAKRFISLVEDPAKDVKVTIFKYVRAGIIKKTTGSSGANQGYSYLDNHLGSSIEEVVIFMNKAANENVVVSMREQYDSK